MTALPRLLVQLAILAACNRTGFHLAPTGPTTADDAAQTWDQSALDIPVLANDSDPHGPIVLASATQPATGTATISGDQVHFL